jgi:formylglycine-generating enzyme required for sulfatase activity
MATPQSSQPRLIIQHYEMQAQCFVEVLGEGVDLEMVLIPGGQFLMGSPEDELERLAWEGPQHQVTIQPFCMGKYPVTQAQWRAIATLPKINRNLNPDPSSFKGSDRPVETITWHDAIEFCDRLSRKTGRSYRLPSEAEWEYACRAGTTTPFHFGETITTDLANYCGEDREISGTLYKGSYDKGPTGSYRNETTAVGNFEVANAFGLYDMHGNVWEWCLDHWHENYEGAPHDGSAWLDQNGNDNSPRVLRGGSWSLTPWNCRLAYRYWDYAVKRNHDVGFRVVCSRPWTR